MKKKLILFNIAIISLVLVIAQGGLAAQQKQPSLQKEQPVTGGTLVVGLGKEPGNPNPFIATISTTQFVREASYESLLAQDDDGRIVPNLVLSYEVSAGGRALTLDSYSTMTATGGGSNGWSIQLHKSR